MGIQAVIAAATIASTGANVYGAVEGRRQSKIAQKEQKQASQIEQAKAAQQNARARRRAIAEQNIALAQRESAAAQSGVDSSAQAGGMGTIQTQTGEAIGFQRGQAAQSIGQIGALNAASAAQSRGSRAAAIGALPGQLGMGFGDLLAMAPQLPSSQANFQQLQMNPTGQFNNNYNPANSFIGRNPNMML